MIGFLTAFYLILLILVFLFPFILFHSLTLYYFGNYDVQFAGDITQKIQDELKQNNIDEIFSAYTLINYPLVHNGNMANVELYLTTEQLAKHSELSWFSAKNILKGRTALRQGEIAVDYATIEKLNLVIGDNIEITINNHVYLGRIVGIYLLNRPTVLMPINSNSYIDEISVFRKEVVEREYLPLNTFKQYPLLDDNLAYSASWFTTELSYSELKDILLKYMPEQSFLIFSREDIIKNVLSEFSILRSSKIYLLPILLFAITIVVLYRESVGIQNKFKSGKIILNMLGVKPYEIIIAIITFQLVALIISFSLSYFLFLNILYLSFNMIVPPIIKQYILILLAIIILFSSILTTLIYKNEFEKVNLCITLAGYF